MSIFAIDQGSKESGWCRLWPDGRLATGKAKNDMVLNMLSSDEAFSVVVIERFACYGMAIGQEVIDAVEWGGRFIQQAQAPVRRIFRREVKLAMTGSPRANDSMIRQAIIDKFGGKEKAVGSKKAPGPLFSVKSDAWSALALALTFQAESSNDFFA